jgi:hypothetical protein
MSYANLVESVRGEHGPRQRHICYLGAVPTDQERITYHRWGAHKFWHGVKRRLDGAGLDDDDRRRIESELEKVVPNPDAKSKSGIEAKIRRSKKGK